MKLIPLTPVLLALPLPAFAQSTITVGTTGAEDFFNVQNAVDAAGEGDTILIRGGLYLGCSIQGKSLTIVGDGAVELLGPSSVFGGPEPAVEVVGLSASQHVTFRGIEIDGTQIEDDPMVHLEDNEGPILFDDCRLAGGGTQLIVERCESVTLNHCEVVAPPSFVSEVPGFFLAHIPLAGLVGIDSHLYLYDTLISGSQGGPSSFGVFGGFSDHSPGPGGVGASFVGGSMLASGCMFIGGDGGDSVGSDCYAGADPSFAWFSSDGADGPTQVTLIDSQFQAGAPGTGTCGLGDGVTPAVDGFFDNADVLSIAGAARSWSLPSPVIDGGALQIQAIGEPGDVAVLWFSLGTAPAVELFPLGIAFHLQLPILNLPLGVVPASGVVDVPFDLPPVAPSGGSLTFYAQASFLSASGPFDAGPRSLTILSPSL